MKLEDQFFHSFFYPFVVGVTLSAAMVIISSIIFTNNYLDLKTADNIVQLEKDYSKVKLNSINIILSTNLLKIQAGLNEIINSYIILANQIKSNEALKSKVINNKFFINAMDISELLNDDKNETKKIIEENQENYKYSAFWFLNETINNENLTNDSDEYSQLLAFSQIMRNVFNSFHSCNFTLSNFYFYFESTELFICYPLSVFIDNKFIINIANFSESNQVWCANEEGEVYNIYKGRCRSFYTNIQNAKSDIFDYNYKDNKNRTIFVTEFYPQAGENEEIVFTMCIEFIDPISGKAAYGCADINQRDKFDYLEKTTYEMTGYFFINPVGFNKVFYFPQMDLDVVKTATENIFKWDSNFYLNEKIYFSNHIQKLMSSNYINYIKDSLYEEIYINGNNSYEQYFSLNGEIFNFSIYPIILENIKGSKEHILNIIYIYNNKMFYDLLNTDTNIAVKVFLEAIIFVVFGSGLLYLIVLSLNILSKYIVIPIKNVNYMLKGINIGGDNRLEYLEFLKKKQDENVELLEKMYIIEDKKNKNENNKDENDNNALNNDNNNNLIDETKDQKDESPLINNDDKMEDNESKGENDTEINNEMLNSKIDYNEKFDEESEFIEKETNFYDFDEQLLQYRPLEIDRLVKALIDLKGALILTSSDQQVEQIIEYSNSEEIFRNFKNKEGSKICQSNIGNLQSQLSKYDKAIYHLASSLEDNKLKRFLSRTLSDELDENDTLLNKISNSYNKGKDKKKNNILVEKQLNNTKDNFSQKIIGILINSRYNRLIHVYFKFFSLIQKSNNGDLSGQFMNKTYHNINYYHKIIIQYIYLSFVKSDIIKIGESILDYIEFLIKFKFRTSKENKYLLDIRNKERPELKRKQYFKKYIFDKIVSWINLFDDYITHVRDHTSLCDDKSIVEDISQSTNSSSNDLDSGSQSVFLFRVNVQRGEYLKGKFALRCKNYNDALFYFIRAAKKTSIVMDGLIKKKSLKRICKILQKIFKKYEKYGIIRWQMRQKIMEYEKLKIRSISRKHSQNKIDIDESANKKSRTTFKQEMEIIKNEILTELSGCNAKQAKDIIIIIDFNQYNENQNNNNIISNKIDSFIDQTKTILDNYLSSNDRLAVFIYTNEYQIICPLSAKNKIDIDSFAKDLIYYKKNNFDENEENEESYEDDINENVVQKEHFDLKSGGISESGSQESFNNEKKSHFKINDIVEGLIKSVNYAKNYLKMKEGVKNEKYLMLFTDLFNNYKVTDEVIENNFQKLEGDYNIIFLLVGINKTKDIQKDKNILIDDDDEEKLNEIINNKYGNKSEVIVFENMKKIKTILSSNQVIKDEIIFPNEIYK